MPSRRLSRIIAAQQHKFESLPPNTVRCVLCWKVFGEDETNHKGEPLLTQEHVVPRKVHSFLREPNFLTVTCKGCNEGMGSFAEDHSKNYRTLVAQDKAGHFSSTDAVFGISGQPPIRGTLNLSADGISMFGDPSRNNPKSVEAQQRALDSTVDDRIENWKMTLNVPLGYVPGKVLLGYIKSAYLVACLASKHEYSYTPAASFIRRLLSKRDPYLAPRALIASRSYINSSQWIGHLREPALGRCLIVKIGGELVLLPEDDDANGRCYRFWDSSGELDKYGVAVRPKGAKLKIDFDSESDYRSSLVDLGPLLKSA